MTLSEEVREIVTEEFRYDNVSHHVIIDGEIVAETWNIELEAEDLDIEKINITDDYVSFEGHFTITVNDNFSIVNIE